MSDVAQSVWTMVMHHGEPEFPFVEDEDANISGLGHQDKESFAAHVNRYEEWCGGWDAEDGNAWTADDIAHVWVVLPEEEEGSFILTVDDEPVSETTPGAVAVTAMWGAR